VVTELDHHANVDPWKALATERGITIRVLPLDPGTGLLELERFPELLCERTRLVALGAASNAIGTLTDIRPLTRMAEAVGAKVFVDAVHLAPHRRIDVGDLGCDFLVCSPYKFFGPHMGVLWMREEILAGMDVPKVSAAPTVGPERFETGTLNSEGMAGTTAAVDFLAELEEDEAEPRAEAAITRSGRLDRLFPQLAEREDALLDQLWNGLDGIRGVRLYGPPPGPNRTPTLSFSVGELPAREVSGRLADDAGAFLSHGDFYAETLVERLGLRGQGLVRAGVSIYNTAEEVDRVVQGVEKIAWES
jgi:cysteine desulfurase family protein (TIGR01976 family)